MTTPMGVVSPLPADATPPTMPASLAVSEAAPALSFGVPLRNAQRFIARLLDSLLAQDFADFEVVVCDNASDDDTQRLCAEYAARDPRVRLHCNPENIGQIANFNLTLELARGRYFRWIGADDWLEPSYARRCVAALEANPGAVGVTTFQDHVDDQGRRMYRPYQGERFDAERLHRRFARMMWSFTADYLFFDPIYSMMRRDALLQTHRLQFVPSTDQVLAAEMVLRGGFVHVAECLAHRRKEYEAEGEEVYKRYAPGRQRQLEPTFWRLLRLFAAMPWRVPASTGERLRCLPSVLRHVARNSTFRAYWRWKTRLAPLRPVLRPVVRATRRLAGRARPPV